MPARRADFDETVMTAAPATQAPTAVPVPHIAGLPPDFSLVLSKLREDVASPFQCVGVRLEPLEYRERPFSHLLRVAVYGNNGSAPVTHLFVKLFKVGSHQPDLERMRRRVVNEFESTRKVHDAMSGSTDLGAVRPIACYPEYLATVTEQVPGQTLLEYLESDAAWVPRPDTLARLTATVKTAGRWVRMFHEIDNTRTGLVSLDAIQSYVDARLARLVANPRARFGEAERASVLEHIARLYAAADSGDLAEVPIHADLAPANMLVSNGRVVVLDFAMCSRGSLFHDLSRLFLQLDLIRLKPQFTRAVIDRLGRALLQGFDSQLTADRPMFRLMLLQHRINHLATVSLASARFPASLYNRRVRRYHRNRLAEELRTPVTRGVPR